ncbi:MAG: hypothetical protein L0387_36130 [Acidobacteria bacterium]|nr:hypothetical protein [Acidobacteriota bacterium]MCI0722135.1 hypothetical protein [Acidobacteriota bacterium]
MTACGGLECLARDPRVDSNRLGCVGLSYGGRMTMLTAALEPRIRAAVISGALNMMQERIIIPYSCSAQVVSGLLQYGDTPEIASLIAPRPCLWEVGTKDELIPARWAEEALTRIRRAYKACDAEDRLIVDRFQGGHAWNGRAAYPWLERILGWREAKAMGIPRSIERNVHIWPKLGTLLVLMAYNMSLVAFSQG